MAGVRVLERVTAAAPWLLVALPAGAFVVDRGLARILPAPARGLEMRVEIAAPVQAVWDITADIGRQPEWMREMKSVRILTPGPIGVGTRGEATVRIFGISVNDPVVVTGWRPPHEFAIAHGGLFSGGGRITLREGVPGTTILEWHEELVPPLLASLGSLVQWPILHWIFQDDLYRLRDLIEHS